jgi:hypothetical protein
LRQQVTVRALVCKLAQVVVLASVVCGGLAWAQQSPAAPQDNTQQKAEQPPPPPLPVEVQKNPVAPCVQPAPTLRWDDYEGPFAKVAGIFARRLERRSVRAPHYKPGALLCTFPLKDKFILFVEDVIDPVTFLSAGFNAGLDQAQNNDPSYGQGASGYGIRFGASMAGQTTSLFFKDFAYPSIFSEDPRYYRLGHGGAGKRLLHAMEHAFVAYRENGAQMFNFSEWLGTTSAVALSNTYHPDNRRGFAPAAERVGYSVANDVGFDILREFWPEIARKFRLPFRGQHEPANHDSG